MYDAKKCWIKFHNHRTLIGKQYGLLPEQWGDERLALSKLAPKYFSSSMCSIPYVFSTKQMLRNYALTNI